MRLTLYVWHLRRYGEYANEKCDSVHSPLAGKDRYFTGPLGVNLRKPRWQKEDKER